MKRTKRNIPKGYDSWFEYDLHQKFKRCEYHVGKLTYTQVKTYEPDFIYYSGDYTIYIEAKGRFRDRAEARKYVDISNALGRRRSWSLSSKTQEQQCPEQDVEVTGQDTPCKNGQKNRDSHGTPLKPVLLDGVKSNETPRNT